jgi:NAD(P)H-dependent FMN reductase
MLLSALLQHNRSYSAAFKNVLTGHQDQCKVFQNKPMLLMSTSPGGYGGNVMNTAKTFFPQFAADIKDTFSLPKFYENFDLESGVINPDMR